MITAVETKSKIREYIVKSTLADVKNLSDDTLIFESGLLDSMGLLFLLEYLKEEFGVEVRDEELMPSNFKSINSIVSFMEDKLPN